MYSHLHVCVRVVYVEGLERRREVAFLPASLPGWLTGWLTVCLFASEAALAASYLLALTLECSLVCDSISRRCCQQLPSAYVLLCRGRWLLGLLVLQSTSSFVLDSYQDLLRVRGKGGVGEGLLVAPANMGVYSVCVCS